MLDCCLVFSSWRTSFYILNSNVNPMLFIKRSGNYFEWLIMSRKKLATNWSGHFLALINLMPLTFSNCSGTSYIFQLVSRQDKGTSITPHCSLQAFTGCFSEIGKQICFQIFVSCTERQADVFINTPHRAYCEVHK